MHLHASQNTLLINNYQVSVLESKLQSIGALEHGVALGHF